MDENVPGCSNEVEEDIQDVDISMAQIDITEKEEPNVDTEDNENAETVLDRLAGLPYQVFVLSEYGRPIFVNSGSEEQLSPLFAVIGVFVSRVRTWDDDLMTISSPQRTIRFMRKPPLVLCIVSKYEEKLDEQLDVLYEQILSILSKTQLETIYQKKGDNYDLRKLLRGTDRLLEASVTSWRGSQITASSSISPLPMAPSDREFLANTMAQCLGAAKLDGALFGLLIAHRQVAAYVRYRKYVIHPRDVNIIINLVSDKTIQVSEAQTWAPICLPHFNDTGFLYIYVAYPWHSQGIRAGLVFLSTKRDHFDDINQVKRNIVQKLEGNGKFFVNFSNNITKPKLFEISQIGSCNESLWSFHYLNYVSKQVCISAAKIPLISRDERWAPKRELVKINSLATEHDDVKTVFVRGPKQSIMYWKHSGKFTLQCVFGPFVSTQVALQLVSRLLDQLKSHEQRYFIINTPSF